MAIRVNTNWGIDGEPIIEINEVGMPAGRDGQPFIDIGLFSLGGNVYEEVISDSLIFNQQVKIIQPVIATSLLHFDEILDNAPCYFIKDHVVMRDALNGRWIGTIHMLEVLSLMDVPKSIKAYLLSVVDAMSMGESAKIAFAQKVADSLSLNDNLSTNMKLVLSILETVSLRDNTARIWELLIEDSLNTADNAISLILLNALLTDGLSLVDSISSKYKLTVRAFSNINFDDVSKNNLSASLLALDKLSFHIILDGGGETYQCWVLNGQERYPSIYSNYDFNSYAVLNGVAYGARSDGIYQLEGGDESVNTGLMLNLANVGSQKTKRFDSVYLGYSGDRVALKMKTEKGEIFYAVTDKRVRIAKGQEGVEWQFELTNAESIEFIELMPIILRR